MVCFKVCRVSNHYCDNGLSRYFSHTIGFKLIEDRIKGTICNLYSVFLISMCTRPVTLARSRFYHGRTTQVYIGLSPKCNFGIFLTSPIFGCNILSFFSGRFYLQQSFGLLNLSRQNHLSPT